MMSKFSFPTDFSFDYKRMPIDEKINYKTCGKVIRNYTALNSRYHSLLISIKGSQRYPTRVKSLVNVYGELPDFERFYSGIKDSIELPDLVEDFGKEFLVLYCVYQKYFEKSCYFIIKSFMAVYLYSVFSLLDQRYCALSKVKGMTEVVLDGFQSTSSK